MTATASSQEGHGEAAPVRIGALAPLTRPGWAEAGRHLRAGFELAAAHVNRDGGIRGRPLELVIRDTGGDPQQATVAVDQLARLGVAALAGEYHSVVARAIAARSEAHGIPFLCSSAVLDALTDQATDWVARLAPPQSRGWQLYSDFLAEKGCRRVALATEPSVYWESGATILRERLTPHGATVTSLDARALGPAGIRDELAAMEADALLLLVGHPDPAVSIVKAVRRDRRLAALTIGAPAGQPEFAEWATLLGEDGAAIPFLRYLPDRHSDLGARVGAELRERLPDPPSFVGYEGYDTIVVLSELLRSQGEQRALGAAAWPTAAVEGTRGEIRFGRQSGISVWQWTQAPIQIVDRDPADPGRLRVLQGSQAATGAHLQRAHHTRG